MTFYWEKVGLGRSRRRWLFLVPIIRCQEHISKTHRGVLKVDVLDPITSCRGVSWDQDLFHFRSADQSVINKNYQPKRVHYHYHRQQHATATISSDYSFTWGVR
jgi:hypothetical protein